MLICQISHRIQAKMNEMITAQNPIDSRNTAISDASLSLRRAAFLAIPRMPTGSCGNGWLFADLKPSSRLE
jgi:hypothetical protein